MKSIDEAEAQARLDEILKEAQRQPIVIRRHAQDAAVVVSMTQYERLRALDVQAFLAVIEVKTDVTPTTLRDALVKLHRNIGIVRQAPNIRACAGLFAFEDGGGDSARFLAAIKEQSGDLTQRVDFVAIGPDRFIRFWEFTIEKPTRFFHSWRSYQMPGLAAGYFLHNIVDAIAQLSPMTSGVWFPPERKEIYSDGEVKASWAATET